MIYPLFGESLFGETLFAQGLVSIIIIPVYDTNSPLVDYRVLQILVVDSRVIQTNSYDIRILKSSIETSEIR